MPLQPDQPTSYTRVQLGGRKSLRDNSSRGDLKMRIKDHTQGQVQSLMHVPVGWSCSPLRAQTGDGLRLQGKRPVYHAALIEASVYSPSQLLTTSVAEGK